MTSCMPSRTTRSVRRPSSRPATRSFADTHAAVMQGSSPTPPSEPHCGSCAFRGSDTLRSSESLRFLVHFVGDVHQPLHLTSRERGGNGDPVLFEGRHMCTWGFQRTRVTSAYRERHPGQLCMAYGTRASSQSLCVSRPTTLARCLRTPFLCPHVDMKLTRTRTRGLQQAD